ncbi:Oxoglutarate/iron-dependent dioxygenase [Macleaya cordata]|uniref:Oxoglutarate/iron-dependent dioxygenase n=1 Tax=Macleaya cordata TaxID=56857 RepID=A0A200RB11_MACCD|nr:Oxoglutarate/iron-dependent dioxygenase [Macleaya cordata]
MESKVLSTGIHYSSLPENYIRPVSERPRLSEVISCHDIPVIDLGCTDRTKTIQLIHHACRTFGFFQVINHGISVESTDRMFKIAEEFFHLPLDEKLKFYSDDPSKTMRLSTSFNVKKETVHNWRDYLRLHCHPLDKFVHDWPSVPPSFKDVVSTYCQEVRQLGFRLLEAVSESLGLEGDHIEKMLGDQGQHMAINYYPPCPQPDLTYGLPAHTDPNTITILLQDQEVAGLQVLKDGQWIAVNPHPNAFVVNIGDQLQTWQRVRVRVDPSRVGGLTGSRLLNPNPDSLNKRVSFSNPNPRRVDLNGLAG